MADNPFANLAGQVINAATAVKGLGTALTGATAAIGALQKAVSGQVLTAVSNFAAAVAKTTTGLAALGAAALPGGFEVLSKTVNYFTSVIGSVATPIFAVLSAAALTVADYFADDLYAAAKAVAEYFVDNFVPTIEFVTRWCKNIADSFAIAVKVIQIAALQIGQAFAEAADWFLSLIGKDDPAGIAKSRAETDRATDRLADAAGALWNAIGDRQADAGKPTDLAGDFADRFTDNFGAVVKSLEKSMADKGNVGFSGIADVAKNVQLQSFKDDIERKTFAQQVKNTGILEGILAELRKPRPGAIGP